MSKSRKIFIICISILLIAIIGAGGYLVNMFGLFNAGNSGEYSASKIELQNCELTDKTMIFLGSSVTYGFGSKGESFVDYLEAKDGVKPIKEAVSGTTLVDDKENSYVSRMKSIDKNIKADVFVCQLSTNDATKNKPLGSITGKNAQLDTLDTHTIAGAIEYIILYAKTTWDCPVIFYTSTKYDSKQYQEMVDLLLDIQKEWGIGVIDLWNDERLNDISESDRKEYMVDNIHPTKKGYLQWWLPVFENKLKQYV